MESECRQQLGEGRFEQRIWRKRHVLDIRELKKSSRGRRRRQAVKIFRYNPYVFLSMYLLWLHCLFLFFDEIQLSSACIPKEKDRRR